MSSSKPLVDYSITLDDDDIFEREDDSYNDKDEPKYQKNSKWKKIFMKCANIQENNGSYARDHLANERTFLAWLRTALATIGFGVGVAQFGTQANSKEAGMIFVILGLIFLVYSTIRYYFLLYLLKRKLFSPNALGLIFVLVLCFFSVMATGFLLLTREDLDPEEITPTYQY